MAAAAHVLEGTQANFRELVLENSARGPVLVHFWAEWAGPCHRLSPLLAGLARDYGGRFLLVNLNTDAHGAIAREHGVTSLPTVKLFRHARVVETVHGYQPEAEWRRLIDRYTGRGVDPAIEEAVRLYRSGQVEEALSRLAQAALAVPDDPRLPLTLGRLLLAQGRLDEAQAVLAALPEATRRGEEVAHLLAHLEILRTARGAAPRADLEARVAADPGDLPARFALGALALVADDYAGALEQFLEVVRRDRGYRDGAARQGMLAVFALLDNRGELVERYRRQLSAALL
jgi:putative thioredoxin